MLDVPLPPPAYVGTYHGPLRVITANLEGVESLCHGPTNPLADGYVSLGCQWWENRTCVIVIPDYMTNPEVTPELARKVTVHEIGHCAGWPANHPR